MGGDLGRGTCSSIHVQVKQTYIYVQVNKILLYIAKYVEVNKLLMLPHCDATIAKYMCTVMQQ